MRELIFKDKDGKDFRFKLSDMKAEDILYDLIEHKELSKKFCYEVITKSNDDVLVSTILGNYDGRPLSDKMILEILKKFPDSECVQINMIYYCASVKKYSVINKLKEDGINNNVRDTAIEWS